MRHSVASMNAASAKEFASSMTVIANEKLKAERDATAGKKKTGSVSYYTHFIWFSEYKSLSLTWDISLRIQTSCLIFDGEEVNVVVIAGAKKKQLIVDKPDDDGLGGGGAYDAADDYDFM